jgi:uncharacterized OB-fold protein
VAEEYGPNRGPYGHLSILEDEGEIPLREGILKFPTKPGEPARIIASKCKKCGDISFPQKLYCGICDGEEMEEHVLSPRGKVYTYTVVHQMGTPGVEVPYALVLVKVPEDDKLLIAGQLTGVKMEDVKIGMDVEIIFGKCRMGMLGLLAGQPQDVIGYLFRPVRK